MGCNQSEPPRPNRGVEAKRLLREGKPSLCRWRGCFASADPLRVWGWETVRRSRIEQSSGLFKVSNAECASISPGSYEVT